MKINNTLSKERSIKTNFSNSKPEIFLFSEHKGERNQSTLWKAAKKGEKTVQLFIPSLVTNPLSHLHICTSVATRSSTHSILPFPQFKFFFQFQMREFLWKILFAEIHRTQTRRTCCLESIECQRAGSPPSLLSILTARPAGRGKAGHASVTTAFPISAYLPAEAFKIYVWKSNMLMVGKRIYEIISQGKWKIAWNSVLLVPSSGIVTTEDTESSDVSVTPCESAPPQTLAVISVHVLKLHSNFYFPKKDTIPPNPYFSPAISFTEHLCWVSFWTTFLLLCRTWNCRRFYYFQIPSHFTLCVWDFYILIQGCRKNTHFRLGGD